MCIYTPIAVNGNDIEYYGEKIGVITVHYYQAEELNRDILFDSHDVENGMTALDFEAWQAVNPEAESYRCNETPDMFEGASHD